ncbi:MAG TPA: 3-hydroxyacyl-CoA dehydrogenase family protein [Candidatus Dormibacteraeota bacterium]|jgi:3-hydroxybutyryl-CoA dehydrogenase|nr:3-hydroxyacyl-CoA dehydrogenase family protein [Candidatus Dormibacteraeota bacterium]
MTIDEIGKVCVVGAGTMGAQIAQQVALAGYPVRLFSRSQERLDAAVASNAKLLGKRVEKGKLDADSCSAALERVTTHTDLAEAVQDAQLVIETVAEERDIKRQICEQLSELASPTAIIASNSSTMASSFFVDCMVNEERLLNVHFFNPALVMQLVEVVRGPHTADETVDTAIAFVRRIGKTPVLVTKETYGFIANRILFIAMQEAFRLVEEGYVSMEDADLAVKNGLNWPMGPFELADLVGLDVTEDILAQGHVQTGEERWKPTTILTGRTQRGELGRKTGKGFYEYANK